MARRKPKILVIGMGGAIGAKMENGRLKYGELEQGEVLKRVSGIQDSFEIDTANIFRMDSADMMPQHWLTLANTIYYKMKDYDGVVITMGTDTMPYAASAISFLIQNINMPIVFTGSQVDPGEPTTDARINTRTAIVVAANSDLGETVIVFNRKIIRGTRARRVNATDFSGFESTGADQLGTIEYSPKFNVPYRKRSKEKPVLYNKLETRVAILKAYPGFDTAIINGLVDKGIKGIVLEGYGLGLLPTLNNSIKEAIGYARKKNVPVIITSDCSLGSSWQSLYEAETGTRIKGLKAIPAYDMITETAYVKLMWVLGQTHEMGEIKRMMQRNYVGEITEFGKGK